MLDTNNAYIPSQESSAENTNTTNNDSNPNTTSKAHANTNINTKYNNNKVHNEDSFSDSDVDNGYYTSHEEIEIDERFCIYNVSFLLLIN